MPYIVGAGGAAMEVFASSFRPIVTRESNPGRIHTASGGVARNITDNSARLGMKTYFLGALGNDAFGRGIISDSEAAGIDMSRVYLSRSLPSSCYLALIDSDGDMYAACSDFDVLSDLPDDYFSRNSDILSSAAAIVADANLSETQIEQLIASKADTPLFFDPVSAAKSRRLLPFLSDIALIKPNIYELEALSGISCKQDDDIVRACRVLCDYGCSAVLVSLGARGCCYFSLSEGAQFKSFKFNNSIRNATGAGDAFLAGFITAHCSGSPVCDCLDIALAAGYISVESDTTINPEMRMEKIYALLSEAVDN